MIAMDYVMTKARFRILILCYFATLLLCYIATLRHLSPQPLMQRIFQRRFRKN